MAQRIIILIKNIKLYRRVKIGNVTFVESTKNVKEERLASYLKNVMSAKKHGNKSERLRDTKQLFENRAVAIFRSAYDDEAAEEDDRKNIECALNILRLYLSRTVENDPFSYKMFTAMEGMAYTGRAIALSSTQDGRIRTNSKRMGYLFAF